MKTFNYCHSCGNYFPQDETKSRREYHHEIDGSFYENIFICPMCGSSEIEEVDNCISCGEPEIDTDDGLCPDCKAAILADLDKWVQEHKRGEIDENVLMEMMVRYIDTH